jgi:hypothetical protein
MKARLARLIMALAIGSMGESRHEWSAAMRAEFETALEEGGALPFAGGCFIAAWRDLLTHEEGRLRLTSYALALGLMIPMAAVQIGSSLLGFPYLYPGEGGLAGALLVGSEHEPLLREFYQSAVPALALLLLSLGIGHLSMAWAMLEHDWSRAMRTGALTLAVATTLILFMFVLFLNSSQALLQTAFLVIELAILSMVARWHAQLCPAAVAEHPG